MYNGAMYPSAGQPYQQGQYPQQYEGTVMRSKITFVH